MCARCDPHSVEDYKRNHAVINTTILSRATIRVQAPSSLGDEALVRLQADIDEALRTELAALEARFRARYAACETQARILP